MSSVDAHFGAYAVYTRTSYGADWVLQDVFGSQSDADREATRHVPVEADMGPGEPGMVLGTAGRTQPPDDDAAVEAVVVGFDSRHDAPKQLPQDRIVPITARYVREGMAT
jgi:hypothetical protein